MARTRGRRRPSHKAAFAGAMPTPPGHAGKGLGPGGFLGEGGTPLLLPTGKDLLAQEGTTGDTPGSPTTGVPPRAGRSFEVKGDVTREYVSAGKRAWYLNYARSLDWAIDDVTSDFGLDLYARMMVDPQVSSAISVLKTGVLEDAVGLQSAVPDADKDGYERARDMVAFCEKALENLATPFDDVLWDILDAVALGNRVAEQVYAHDSTYTGKTQLILRTLKVKPQTATAFVVNIYNDVIGLLGLVPGIGIPVQVGSIIADPGHLPHILPREKFAVLSNRPRNNDPRGTSVLRSAYDSWFLKEQLKGEFMAYLSRFASPSLMGNTDPNSVALPQLDSNGEVVLDANGSPVVITPEQALLNSLLAFHNGTALVLPPEAKVEGLAIPQHGQIFLETFTHLDRQITKAILNQTLATEEGTHRSGTDSATHQDVLHTVIRHAKKAVKRMLRRDILALLVRLNYGDKYVTLAPIPTLGDTESPDFATDATAVSALQTSGYLEPRQYAGIDAKLGLPPRDPETMAVQEKAHLAGHMQALAIAQMPPADAAAIGKPATTQPRAGAKPAAGSPAAGAQQRADATPSTNK